MRFEGVVHEILYNHGEATIVVQSGWWRWGCCRVVMHKGLVWWNVDAGMVGNDGVMVRLNKIGWLEVKLVEESNGWRVSSGCWLRMTGNFGMIG